MQEISKTVGRFRGSTITELNAEEKITKESIDQLDIELSKHIKKGALLKKESSSDRLMSGITSLLGT